LDSEKLFFGILRNRQNLKSTSIKDRLVAYACVGFSLFGSAGAWRYLKIQLLNNPRYFFEVGETNIKMEKSNIEFENELQQFIKLHQLRNLDEVCKIPVDKLLKMDGFGYRLLHFLLPDLIKHGNQ